MKKLSLKTMGQVMLLAVFAVFTFHKSLAQNSGQTQTRNIPTYLYGTVTDCYNGDSLSNVIVTAMATDTFITETSATGNYKMLVVADTFDVVFAKPGIHSDTVFGKIAPRGVRTEISRSMCKIPFPPGWVFLNPNEADTEAVISWSWPCPDYEIIYDDGDAEDFALWVQAGGKSAVRFTPAGYPATVKGGRIYVGDGSFPVGADFLGTDFAVGICDDDGPDGMPGTVLDSVVVTVNNYEWVSFENLFNRTFLEGDFYLVMWQLGAPPNAAPLGIDTDVPTVYRSYVAMAGTGWIVSPYQDFMMRTTVGSPNNNATAHLAPAKYIIPPRPPAPVYIATAEPSGIAGTVKSGIFKPLQKSKNSDDVISYDLAWIDNFNPDNNEEASDGILHPFPGNESSPYTDSEWGARPPGFYAYAVRANYEHDTSAWAYSNIAAHLLDHNVEITIDLCDDSIPEDVEVLLLGKQYPYQLLEGIATIIPESKQAVMLFDSVINGVYDLTVYKVGYQGYFHFDIEILDNYTESVNLQENMFPPNNLCVDSITSIATWEPAWITQLVLEDFEEDKFPPDGWQKKKGMGEVGWYRANEADFGFTVPPGDGYYAVVNSYMIGSGPYETDNYLIMPEMDLRQSPDYKLYFDHFFNGGYGETAQIKYSTDTGNTWETYFEVTPVSNWSWNRVEVDLSPISGPEGLRKVWLALYYSDNRNWAQGWTVDNVSVHNGPAPVLGYYVYLNDNFIAETSPDVTAYTFNDLIYGLQYKASVQAHYNCGLSDTIHYSWGSGFLYAPRHLVSNYFPDTDKVSLHWLVPVKNEEIIPDGLLGFAVYQNNEWLVDVAYNGEGVLDTIHHVVSPLDPACYTFAVAAIYDLGVFGFPGGEAESIRLNTDSICVVWGYGLPFFEDWNEGDFTFNGWRLDDKGWTVNSNDGFPAPAAEFNSDMLTGLLNYNSSLTSNPFKADGMTEGEIFVDFNIKLENINATANEILALEISTDAGKTWDSLCGFNNNGSFGFEEGFRHINITDFAKGNIFHIRFNARGKNASDIQSWRVDNIRIYRTCAPPTQLAGMYFWEADDWGVKIDWRIPEIIDSATQWIFWDNENFTDGFGFGSGVSWSVAQRWDAGQLKEWEGKDLSGYKITKISIVLNDDGFSSIVLRIWSGEHAATSLYQQTVENPVIGEWMEVKLDTPVDFNIDSALWIGYSVNGQTSGSYPAAYDNGPAVSGYGDMFYLQGKWWKSSQLGLNNNWALHAFLEKLPDNSTIPSSFYENKKHRGFSVFNLYRQEIGVDNDYVLYDVVPLATGQLAYSYFDYAPAVTVGQAYNYQVTASWASDMDACESAPALSIPGTEDYVTVLVTEAEVPETFTIKLYPIPVTHRLNISSPVQIERVFMYNSAGQKVFDKKFGNKNLISIATSSFQAGIYVVGILTDKGLHSRRVILTQ